MFIRQGITARIIAKELPGNYVNFFIDNIILLETWSNSESMQC